MVIVMSVAIAAPVIPKTGIRARSRKMFAMDAIAVIQKASFGRLRADRLIVPRYMKTLTICTSKRKKRADVPSTKVAP
jgi:hypothetical protein